MPEISILVPVYNVEPYLERCLTSIKNQTFTNFECIIVDDGSPDNSIDICNKFARDDSRFKIIRKENEGLPYARKTGYENAKGKYLIFIDSDDWMELDTLELLHKSAVENKSDIVISHFYHELIKKTEIVSFNLPQTHKEWINAFTIKPGYMNYFWNKLISKEFFDKQNISFPKNISLCEDLDVTFKLFYGAEKISQVNKPLYHYNRQNLTSMTLNYTEKSVQDKFFVCDDIIKFLQDKNASEEYSILINFYKLYTKLMLILYPNLRDPKRWTETYPEANKWIWKVPLRLDYKVLSWLCSKNQFKLAYKLQDLKK